MPDISSLPQTLEQKIDWADEDLDTPSITSTVDPITGIKTTTAYSYENGKKVKITRKIKTVKAKGRVSHSEALRKSWTKFGAEKGHGPGPQTDTTSVGENIKLNLIPGYSTYAAKQREKEEASETAQLKSTLSNASLKCRICKGEHFTARCPYKETLKPLDGGDADPAAQVMEAVDSNVGATGAGGKYVPMHMRAGAKPSAGASQMSGGAGSRDEFPTLRVTNLSQDANDDDLHALFGQHGRVARVYLARDKDTKKVKGFAFISFYDRVDAEKAQAKMNGFGYDNLILNVEFSKPRDS